jgi:hypothetical protein
MSARLLVLVALAIVASSAACATATAATWRHVSPASVNNNVDDPDLQRTPYTAADGSSQPGGYSIVEHVRDTPNTSVYTYTLMGGSTFGTVLAREQLSTPWVSLTDNPGVTLSASSIRVLFAGIHSLDSSDPRNSQLVQVFSRPLTEGAAWALEPGFVSTNQADTVGESIAADEVDSVENGVLFQYSFAAWANSSGMVVKAGYDAVHPNINLQTECCVYDQTVAIVRAPTGSAIPYEAWGVWYSAGPGRTGIFAQRFYPTLGARVAAPQSADAGRNNGIQPQMQIRTVGNLVPYCAGYPTCTSVRVWNFQNQQSMTVARIPQGSTAGSVSIAPAVVHTLIWRQDNHIRHALFSFSGANTWAGPSSQRIDPPAGAHVNGSVQAVAMSSAGGSAVFWANLNVNGVSSIWNTSAEPELQVVQPAAVFPSAVARVVLPHPGPIKVRTAATIRAFGTTWHPTAAGVFSIRVPAATRAGTYRTKVVIRGAFDTPIAIRVRAR